MEIVYFDTQNGNLQFEAVDLTSSLQESTSKDTVPLCSLLRADDFPYSIGDFKKQRDKWTRDDMLAAGNLALRALGTHEAEPLLRRDDMDRLYVLGHGPSQYGLRSEFGSKFWQYRDNLDSKPGRNVQRFDDWKTKDFTGYALKLSQKLNRKPTSEDYRQASRDKKRPGPNTAIIAQKLGTINQLNELIGFPNIFDWNTDDYIDWGVKVYEANNDTPPQRWMIDSLASLERGPGTTTVITHFGSLSKFQSEVKAFKTSQDFQNQKKQIEVDTQLQLLEDQGYIPASSHLEDDRARRIFVAKFMVAKKCLDPGTAESGLAKVAALGRSKFLSRLREYNASLDDGYIEMIAASIDCYDDIWPSQKDWRSYLKAPRT